MNQQLYDEKKKRIIEIDLMKGVGIILVVLGHLEPGKFLLSHIYSFHMFMFFFVSGVLSFNSINVSPKELAKKKIIALLIPYFFWNIAALFIDIIIGKVSILTAIKQMFFIS